MTVILICIILGCFGSIAAAVALLLGVQSPAYLSIATGIGIAVPLGLLFIYMAFMNAVANAASEASSR